MNEIQDLKRPVKKKDIYNGKNNKNYFKITGEKKIQKKKKRFTSVLNKYKPINKTQNPGIFKKCNSDHRKIITNPKDKYELQTGFVINVKKKRLLNSVRDGDSVSI